MSDLQIEIIDKLKEFLNEMEDEMELARNCGRPVSESMMLQIIGAKKFVAKLFGMTMDELEVML